MTALIITSGVVSRRGAYVGAPARSRPRPGEGSTTTGSVRGGTGVKRGRPDRAGAGGIFGERRPLRPILT